MKNRKIILAVFALLFSGIFAVGAMPRPTAASLLVAMRQELLRSMEDLKSQPMPPYFLGYEISESHSVAVRGAYGTILSNNESRSRLLNIDLRIGDRTFDNTHPIRGGRQFFDFADRFSVAPVPVEDNPEAIRQILWYQTDKKYKQAIEQYTRAKANSQVKVAPEDASGDFSKEPPEKYEEAPLEVRVDRAEWEKKIRTYTAPFAASSDIYEGEATLSVEGETRWYVNSEGSELETSSAYYRLILSAYTKADRSRPMVCPMTPRC